MKRAQLLKDGRILKINDQTYKVVNLIGQGGSGEVYKAAHGQRGDVAIKVFFPFYDLTLFGGPSQAAKKIEETVEFQKREYKFLSRLSHPNIVKVFDAGEIALNAAERKSRLTSSLTTLPALVTEFIDGVSFGDAIAQLQMSPQKIAHALRRVAHALEYLHTERQYLHVDIKGANIMVRKTDCEPILIDFALCKNLNFMEVNPAESTVLAGDWDLFPNLPADHGLKKLKERGGRRDLLADLALPALDLFQVGKLLQSIMSQVNKVVDQRDLAYLELLAEQLTDWEAVSQWSPSDLVAKLERLGPDQYAPFGVPELAAPTSTERTIMIPPGIGVPVTPPMERLIDNRSFRRLATIHQLCLLNFTYPAADYKRFVHVLYSYELARQFITHLYGAPLFRSLFDSQSARQLLAVALLHDINHFPFLHIFQESKIPGLEVVQVLDLFCNGDATGERSHGQLSIYELLDEIGISQERFKRLLFKRHHEQEGEIDQAMSSILNSGVDIDKLSYLFYDSYFTGVRYGSGIDYSCILKAATLRRVGTGHRPHIAFTDRALQALENVVMTRFWNFRALYWHHTNRAVMAMLLYVVRRVFVERKVEFLSYLRETLWSGDMEAARYLDRQYKAVFDKDSILHGLIEDRSRLYKRLYTVRPGMDDDADDDLFRACRNLDFDGENCLREKLASALADECRPTGGGAFAIEPEEVLIDIPRREMDSGGNVYLAMADGATDSLGNISAPVHAIDANYERLTKRVRFFVSPRVAERIGNVRVGGRRKAIRIVITKALDKEQHTSEVQ